MAQQLKTDRTLFLTVVAMVCFGLVMVYSASSVMAEMRFQDSNRFLFRQMGWAVASFIALMYFKRKDYRSLRGPTWAFAPLGLVMALLVVVYFADRSAHRWLRFGSIGIQPSEFARPALVIFLAWFVTRRAHVINTRHTLAPAALALGVLAAVVTVADLGTAAVLVCTGAAVFYVAGLDKRYFLVAFGACVLVLPVAILSKPYRLHRIIGYLDQSWLDKIDPAGRINAWASQSLAAKDSGYQVRQSKIAVGAGGALGLGLMQGRQKHMYLPEAHNDFIYAVISEELGLWGATAVLAAYIVILWRGFRLYWLVHDDFGRYLALGVSTVIVCQALMNISVVLDLAPTKGFPLPMISYGGSSLLSTLSSLGILMSVSEHAG
ncbi:MAG: FtsW/RodA/SpoVE family cell cycle protein [Acidobacteria bacterium]|nr:FtsW/RodA/SpoVE family cell cycle protein [Acidobacteriota bacterium]